MVKLARVELDQSVQKYLDRRTAKLIEEDASKRAAMANSMWRSKSATQFRLVREALASMCSGIERCMYCEDSVATDIDHHEPKVQAPLRAFEWQNYLAACSACNSNYKRSEFPRSADGEELLIDPARTDPEDHLIFSPSTGRYTPVEGSELAFESIRVLRLNRETLALGRRNAWILIEAGIIAYAHAHRERTAEEAGFIAAAIQRQPFAGVLKAFLKAAATPGAGLIAQAASDALAAHPEIVEWAPGAA